MKRRGALIGAGLVAASRVALGGSTAAAQSSSATEKLHRLGVLTPGGIESLRTAILPELGRRGFVEGRNLAVELRSGTAEEMPTLARQLVASGPDAILAISINAVRAAQDATRTIPIVMWGDDPIAQGFAASLARPGGNVTGAMIMAVELDAKRLQLLHEAIPAARAVAALLLTGAANRSAVEQRLQAAATELGIGLLMFRVSGPEDYPAAFAAMRAANAQALLISAHSSLARDAVILASLSVANGLPTICEWAYMAQAGCLLGYGPSRVEQLSRLADYVARIFNGATPANMPIEGPTRFEFAVNMKTARAIGLDIQPGLLIRADEVIE